MQHEVGPLRIEQLRIAHLEQSELGVAAGRARAVEGGRGKVAARRGPSLVGESLGFQARDAGIQHAEEGLVEIRHTARCVTFPILRRHRDLAHQIDQVALHLLDESARFGLVGRQRGLGHAETDIEFVDPPVGHDAHIRLGHATTEQQRRRPIIPRFGRNTVHRRIKHLRIIQKQPIKIS